MEEQRPKGRILLVDDTPATITMVRTVLEGEGHDVIVANNGEKAVRRASTQAPDLILLDIMMPVMDGYETCRRLKAQDTTRDIPVLFMSALSDTFDKVRGFEEGAVDYVTKPIDAPELLSRISTHLALRHLQRELHETNTRLEERVSARTEELHTANLELQKEIVERMKAEQSIRRSQEKYRLLVDNAPMGIFSFDTRGRILEINRSLIEILGSPSAEATKAINVLTFAPLVKTGLPGLIHHCLEERETQLFEGPYTSKWGKQAYWRIILTPTLGEFGVPTGCHALVEDITEQKKAEQALLESEEKYRTLFEQSTDAIIIVSPEGEIIDANSASGELFGVPRSELLGADILQFYSDPSERAAILEAVDKRGFIKNYEWNIRRRDGKERTCLIATSEWRDEEGNLVAYRTIARDVTEFKEVEEQLRQATKMEAVGQLAGGIAHDFNNLLQVIQGYAYLISAVHVKEGQPGHQQLREISRAAKNAAGLTRGLLTFSRQVGSELRPVALNHELYQVTQMLERTMPKMIAIELDLALDLDTVNADPTQLQQVIMNLALNARDAMPEGGKLVIETRNVFLDTHYCESHLGTKPGDYVMLAVSDSGCGIDKDTLDLIFDPFFTTKETGKGTGLGLSIVYGIVKNHGGRILCYSEPGVGTTFKIYLPAVSEKAEIGGREPKVLPVGGTETILLVDDEKSVRGLGEEILTTFGYKVLTASTGREGLDVFRKRMGDISLVILDLMMPEMGGRECLKEIMSIDPTAKVLIASGYASNGNIGEALQEGAMVALRKPYETSQMLDIVRRVLDE